MAIYGYTRVSTALQVDGTSLGDQRRRIQAIADFHGWTIEEMFEDRGVSGGDSLHTRPMGHHLVAKLRPGDHDAAIVATTAEGLEVYRGAIAFELPAEGRHAYRPDELLRR